jgi:hypothetical protein
MTIEQRVQYLNITANQDLTPAACLHKAVTVNGTIAPSPGLAVGFLKSHGASGAFVRVADAGVVKVVAGAAVTTIGYPVTITTSGFVIAASSGGSTIGRAWTAASSGDVFPIQTDCANFGQYNGT